MEHFDKEGDNLEIIRAARKLHIYPYTLEYCHSLKIDQCCDHAMNLIIVFTWQNQFKHFVFSYI